MTAPAPTKYPGSETLLSVCEFLTLAFCEYCSLSSMGRAFHASPNRTLIALLSLPGCCCISSSRYFLANSMKPFMGRLARSGSAAFLRAGDMGGLIMISPGPLVRTEEGSREAIPCRRGGPPLLGPPAERGPPGDGDNWSERSWLQHNKKKRSIKISQNYKSSVHLLRNTYLKKKHPVRYVFRIHRYSLKQDTN